MRALGDLPAAELRQALAGEGVALRTGPFVYRIRTPDAANAAHLRTLYARHPLAAPDDFEHFDVQIKRVWRPRGGAQLAFESDGERPFALMPLAHANPMLEWAMNWCIATQVMSHVLIHAAVLERDGRALVLPAPPGSGKSTLCAGLMLSGWRLLTDEMALLTMETQPRLLPLGRGVSLKNQSIALIREFSPLAQFTQVTHDTIKGSIAHLAPLPEHVARLQQSALPGWIVFPQYAGGAATEITPLPRPAVLLDLMGQSFNAQRLGLPAFKALTSMLGSSSSHHIRFGSLQAGLQALDTITREAGDA